MLPLLSRTAARGVRPYSTTISAPVTPRKPASIRSGVVGFLFGSTVSGYAAWTYLAEEYRVHSEALGRDVDALRDAVGRVESYVRVLEGELQEAKRRK